MSKVVTSAIIVKPPDEEYDQIQEIRRLYDKAYNRWMPHINMIYPFVPEDQFNNHFVSISKALSNFEPFSLRFSEFSFFEHGRSCTIFLNPVTEPPDTLQKLHKVLFDLFPFCDDLSTRSENGFSPHLTCGQFTTKALTESKQAEFNASLRPIEFVVNCIQLISRSGDAPFSVKHTIPLGVKFDDIVIDIKPPEKKNIEGNVLSGLDPDMVYVTDRILAWLRHQKEIYKLPKTIGALKSATYKLCIVPKEIISVNTVYDTLLKEGYFSVSNDEVTYQKHVWGQVENKRYNTQNEAEVVLYKAREWICQPGNSPKFVWSLKNSLRQMATGKNYVPQEDVFTLLEKIGSLTLLENNNILINV